MDVDEVFIVWVPRTFAYAYSSVTVCSTLVEKRICVGIPFVRLTFRYLACVCITTMGALFLSTRLKLHAVKLLDIRNGTPEAILVHFLRRTCPPALDVFRLLS